jgi:hypothetical protein
MVVVVVVGLLLWSRSGCHRLLCCLSLWVAAVDCGGLLPLLYGCGGGVGHCVGYESVPTEVVGGDFLDLVVDFGGFSLGGGVLEWRNLVCCRLLSSGEEGFLFALVTALVEDSVVGGEVLWYGLGLSWF